MQTARAGFTIVELLIVVVVIGILAAITLVTFNGIQDSARAAKVSAAVDVYVKGIEIYRIKTGGYPDTFGEGDVCLGTLEHYPAQGGLNEGVCFSDGSRETKVSTSVNNALKTVLSTLPDGTMPKVTDSYGQVWRGLWYSGESTQFGVSYMLKGDQSCPRGIKDTSQTGLTLCEILVSNNP